MGKRVRGSVVATLSGWVAGWIALVFLLGYEADSFRHWQMPSIGYSLGFLALMGFWIVPVWAVILVPLYLLVPWNNFLWKPFVCVPLGALAGYLVMQIWVSIAQHTIVLFVWPSIPAAIVGATTCLVGTLTYSRVQPPKS